MDVVLEKKKSFKFSYPIIGAVAIVLCVVAWLVLQPSAAVRVDAADIWVGQVKQGNLQQSVSGFGTLKSKTTRLLTSYSNATVDEILLRPGSIVSPDSVILKLFDPELDQAVKTAQRTLTQSKNQYLQLEINQKRELLSEESALEVLRSSLESAELEVSAQTQLIGHGIVSNIDYQRSLLEQRQLTRRLNIEQKRVKQLTELHQANLEIAKSNIKAQEEALALIQQTQDRLTVKAGIAGVMQSLSVELGQSVTPGQQLALVGSMSELYALINIPQANMRHVALQQNVNIDTRSGHISGVVSRIEPMVTNGSIQVEVTLHGDLTENARPELNVAGTISTGTLENVLYVQKPINGKAGAEGILYLLDESGKTAVATTLQYGAETKDTIQIVSGASVNQRFILSDMSRWKEHAALSIVQ
jgi:multidrug resistance efflux pump